MTRSGVIDAEIGVVDDATPRHPPSQLQSTNRIHYTRVSAPNRISYTRVSAPNRPNYTRVSAPNRPNYTRVSVPTASTWCVFGNRSNARNPVRV
jgi:hypothetical protein